MLTAAPKTLCREIFLSAPYSTIVPKKPALWGHNMAAGIHSQSPPAHQPLSPYTPSQSTSRMGADPQCPWGNSRPGSPWRGSSHPTQQEAIRASHVRMTCRCQSQLLPESPPQSRATRASKAETYLRDPFTRVWSSSWNLCW